MSGLHLLPDAPEVVLAGPRASLLVSECHRVYHKGVWVESEDLSGGAVSAPSTKMVNQLATCRRALKCQICGEVRTSSMMDPEMAAILVRQAPDGLLVVDEDGTVQWFNPRAKEMFGYRHVDLLGLSVEQLLPETMRSAHIRHRLRFQKRPAARPMGSGLPLLGLRKDGTKFPVEISLSFFDQEETRLVVAAVRDETQRLLIEQQLAGERQHKAALLESLGEGFMEVDTNGLVVNTNTRFCQMVDLSPEAILGAEPPYRWWPPDAADQLVKQWNRLLDKGGGAYEGVNQRSDGTQIFVEGSLTPVVGGDNGPGTLLNVVRDVTGRVETESALREAEQAIAVANDRERIARNLHDNVIQQIFAVGLGLQAAAGQVDGLAAERLEDSVVQLDATIAEIRHTILGLHGGQQQTGVRHEFLRVVEDERHALGFDPSLAFEGSIDQIPSSTVTEITAVLREALSNTVRHANASEVHINARLSDGHFTLTVDDNGGGLDPTAKGGSGLENMARRAAELNGDFEAAVLPTGGTRIRWRVPTTG